MQTKQDKQFPVMSTFRMLADPCTNQLCFFLICQSCCLVNTSPSLDLIILILLLGRFVLIKEIPGEHFLSKSSGKKLYTASFTESWRELINEYAIFFIALRTFKFWFFISFAACCNDSKTSLQTLENRLPCELKIIMYWLNI